MSTILCIETSTSACSCSLSRNGEIVLNNENLDLRSHATLLGVFVEETMQHIRNNHLTLSAVAVSVGPGSYTGLRIGVSEAKGVAYGLGIPIIALSTPTIMASMTRHNTPADALLCPMIDARRMEVYATFFDTSLNIVRETSADIVDESSYAELLDKNDVYFFGNGSGKCRPVITHPRAHFIADIHPTAAGMAPLAEKAFAEKDFADVAYFEPFYLKDFVATVPKNKIMGA